MNGETDAVAKALQDHGGFTGDPTRPISGLAVTAMIHDLARQAGDAIEKEMNAKGEAAGMTEGMTVSAVDLMKSLGAIIESSRAARKAAIEDLRSTRMALTTEVVTIEKAIKTLAGLSAAASKPSISP